MKFVNAIVYSINCYFGLVKLCQRLLLYSQCRSHMLNYVFDVISTSKLINSREVEPNWLFDKKNIIYILNPHEVNFMTTYFSL
jgi:hypothetical protein